ncbi:hypothetical protein [Pararhodobacter sp.]|uniref:hypothetical protein n=1 Tax=Pararhodobacter sp. TaxID=2127056 RepID=UPI002FDE49AB
MTGKIDGAALRGTLTGCGKGAAGKGVWMRQWATGGLMALGHGVLGAVAAMVLGLAALQFFEWRGQTEGSTMMGYAIGFGYFGVPLGFVLGCGVGIVRALRRPRGQ